MNELDVTLIVDVDCPGANLVTVESGDEAKLPS